MTGRIIKLIDDQQFGTIAAEDGIDYVFHSRSLIAATFGSLQVGTGVTFTPIRPTRRAEDVRISATKRPTATESR